MSKYDAEFIEYIVQEVIRRLTAGGVAISRGASSSPPNDTKRELVLSERLITLATLAGRLEGVARVIVPRKALVTPAVRDELRARSIELQKQ